MTEGTTNNNELVTLTSSVDGIATLTLNDPANRNGLSHDVSLRIAQLCDQINGDSTIKVVIVTGAGEDFSAGSHPERSGEAQSDVKILDCGPVALGALVVPTIAAVNGLAAGAGLTVALTCDIVLAARSAAFDAEFLTRGLHPGGGLIWRLNRLVGRQTTAALVLFGESLEAEHAARLGLVWSIVDDSRLEEETQRLASRVASQSSELVKRTKTSLRTSIPIMDERHAIDLEQVAQEWSIRRPAYASSLSSIGQM